MVKEEIAGRQKAGKEGKGGRASRFCVTVHGDDDSEW